MASSCSKSETEVNQWIQRVHAAQNRRSPEALEEARQNAERSRLMELNYRKSKAVKSHMVRSRALAAESMNQMANSAGAEHLHIQERWKSAQAVSKKRQDDAYRNLSAMPSAAVEAEAAVVLADADEEEEEAMGEVADLMGAADYGAMVAVGNEGLPGPGGAPPAPAAIGAAPGAASQRSRVQELLEQFEHEPEDEAECAAKFMLYDGYSEEVKEMRETLFKFVAETRPTVPDAVGGDMDRKMAKIDSQESMGVFDEIKEWIVYHMMRQAERNNLNMAAILDAFEKKLQFLAANDQTECPVCLEAFAAAGPNVAQTLGCCHKVCKECWDNWTVAMHGRPFCPLCKNQEFLGAVAARMSAAPGVPMSDDSD